MKRNNNNKELLIKRTKKKLKRKLSDKKYNSDSSFKYQSIRVKYERKVIENYKSRLYQFLIEKRFIVGTEDTSTIIKIGLRFSLDTDYDETIEKISDIVYSIWNNIGATIEIDFSGCSHVDQSALFLLQILRLEFQEEFEKLGRRLSVLDSKVKINVIESKDEKVNLYLFLSGLINEVTLENRIEPIESLGFLKGSKQQKAYLENKKGLNASKIVSYINRCLIRNGFELNVSGRNEITNLIGEVLNNAEDHSPFNTYYVTANYHHENEGNVVGELNLSFLNFGYSIFEGLEENKNLNKEVYDFLEVGYQTIMKQTKRFSKDNLFTLFALQDGISRLKFEDESRGTGTMKFIRCFFAIGDYQDSQKGKNPHLCILSGKTRLICDKQHEPFSKENKYFVTLNKEKNLLLPPERSHLNDLRYSFPGTILSVKVFLNNEHIKNKFGDHGNN